MNSEDFVREYNCEVGSPMNPPVEDNLIVIKEQLTSVKATMVTKLALLC